MHGPDFSQRRSSSGGERLRALPEAGKQELTPEAFVRLAADVARDKKGEDILLLDLRAFPVLCDFFLIVSGRSELHVRAIADAIAKETVRRQAARPWHVEGLPHGRWVLLDYVDWVVHVFHVETRDYYLLERLWADAPVERLSPPAEAEDDAEDDAAE
jgi:ribosome-associated protein